MFVCWACRKGVEIGIRMTTTAAVVKMLAKQTEAAERIRTGASVRPATRWSSMRHLTTISRIPVPSPSVVAPFLLNRISLVNLIILS